MNDELLIENIKALLHLNASNSLVPHGIGNHARDLLEASVATIDRLRAENAAQALLIASLKEREQTLRDSKRQTETDASDRINTLTQQLYDTQRQNAKLMEDNEQAYICATTQPNADGIE